MAFANIFMPLMMYSFSNIKSLIFEMKSPILAVTSRMSISNDFKTSEIPLKAKVNPPPTIDVIILKIANIPLKVLDILSAVSSVILIFSVNLCNVLIMPYN